MRLAPGVGVNRRLSIADFWLDSKWHTITKHCGLEMSRRNNPTDKVLVQAGMTSQLDELIELADKVC